MSSSEDWERTRQLRGKKSALPQVQHREKRYFVHCVECDVLIPFEEDRLLCGMCAKRLGRTFAVERQRG